MNGPSLPSVPTRLGEALVTADVVALFLGVDRSTVFRIAGRGLPVVEIGRAKRFRPADVRAYVESSTRTAQPRPNRVERMLGRVGRQ